MDKPGLLVMVACDEDGVVYDLWYHPASYHEVRSFRLKREENEGFRYLLKNSEFIGDKGCKGCEGVRVCKSKEERVLRQAVESVNAWIKLFNSISKWRKGVMMLAYLLG